jgi:hypothetical protein
MILPEWRACEFSSFEHDIKNKFIALERNVFSTLILGQGTGFADTGSILLLCPQLAIVG